MAKKSKKRVSESSQELQETASTEARVRRAEEESVESRPIVKNVVALVLVLLGLYLLLSSVLGWRDRQDGDKVAEDGGTSQVEDVKEPNNDKKDGEAAVPGWQSADTTVSETDEAYNYTIGEGESYTSIARRAIASTASNLTPAERVAAETKIMTDANAEWLDVGQKLTLTKDTVRAAVDWAKSLGGEQKAAWQPYADLVAW